MCIKIDSCTPITELELNLGDSLTVVVYRTVGPLSVNERVQYAVSVCTVESAIIASSQNRICIPSRLRAQDSHTDDHDTILILSLATPTVHTIRQPRDREQVTVAQAT